MKRYNITTGATTTAGGKVISGLERTSFNGQMIAREGDRVACPACGTRSPAPICTRRGAVDKRRLKVICVYANAIRHRS